MKLEIQEVPGGQGGYIFIPPAHKLFGINHITLSDKTGLKFDYSQSVKEARTLSNKFPSTKHTNCWAIGIHIDTVDSKETTYLVMKSTINNARKVLESLD